MICNQCEQDKHRNDFYKHHKLERQTMCKKCSSEYHKNRYKIKKEHDRIVQNEYRKTKRYRTLHHKDTKLNWIRHKKKQLARQKALYAVKIGKIKRKNCMICNSPESQMHHDNYDKPLEVVWLCIPHHRERDKMVMDNIGGNNET